MNTTSRQEAKSFIYKNRDTGIEMILNESIHFGVGSSIYTFLKDANLAGCIKDVDYQTGANYLFVHLTHAGVTKMIHWLGKHDDMFYTD